MIAFGSGLSDPGSGVQDDAAAHLRVQAWRLAAQAEALGHLEAGVRIDFQVADQADPYAQAARLAAVLDRLIQQELPALTRAIRCEARLIRRRSPSPAGARIDPGRTWLARRQTRGRDFALTEVRRVADTPVNRVIATHLRAIEALLRRLRALPLFEVERVAVARAREGVTRFLAISPLAGLAPLSAQAFPRAARAARRRKAEWRRVASFDAWHALLAKIEVGALRRLGSGESITRGPAFELAVAAGVLLALAEGIAETRWSGAGLSVDSVAFGANRHFTVRLRRGDREAHLQARDLALPTARDLVGMLHPRCVLVAPGALRVEAPLFCVPVAEIARLAVYGPIIDALVKRLTEPPTS